MNKLLIPVDYSDVSKAAIDFGMQLAYKYGYEVILHHALNLIEDDNRFYFDSLDMTRRELYDEEEIIRHEKRLENFSDRWNKHGLSITTSLTNGSFNEDIKELVHTEGVGLVVIGTHGVTGLKELFIGSHTEKVVRQLHCPVLVVHKHVKLENIKRILIPVDLDNLQPIFFTKMAILQQLFDAELEFTWVKTPDHSEPLELLVEEFENLLRSYKMVNSSFSILMDAIAHAGILAYADEIEADLIAMPSHHRTGLSHFFKGSVTENVLNHAHIPLWVFSLDELEEPIRLANFHKGEKAIA